MNKTLLSALIALPGILLGAEITLVDQVAVRAPTVTLGEIAIIDTKDLTLGEELRNLDLGAAPRLGQARVITAFKIRGILEKIHRPEVVIKGLQSSVRTERQDWTPEYLQREITAWISERWGNEKEIELIFQRLPREWKVPAGDYVELSISAGRSKMIGATSLTLKAIMDGQVASVQRARVEIKLYEHRPVFIRPVPAGEKVTAEHLELRRIEVTKATGMEIAQLQDVVGMVAKRDISIGQLPSIKAFERPLLVEKGSVNRIVIVNGDLRMSVMGAVALQGGRRGDLIQFSNPMNNEEVLRARVVRPGLGLLKVK